MLKSLHFSYTAENKKSSGMNRRTDLHMAERVGFEPTEACTSLVFKTRAFNHSATFPYLKYYKIKVNTRQDNYPIALSVSSKTAFSAASACSCRLASSFSAARLNFSSWVSFRLMRTL